MEFDIGTLLYIIVTIIAIVAGVSGKKKKPGSANPEGSGSEKRKGFLEDMQGQFGAFFEEAKTVTNDLREEIGIADDDEVVYDENVNDGEEVEAGEMDSFQEEVTKSKDSSYSHFEGLYDPEKQQNADLIRSEAAKGTDKDEILEIIDLDEAYYPDYFEIVKDFDLGTAVVYSTIINRREY